MSAQDGNFDKCLFREPPFCAAACPFGYDVVEFIDRVSKENYAAAFRLYRDAVVFPRIVAALCPEPCKGVCPRANTDEPIDLKFLEKSVIDLTDDTSPNSYNLPARGKRVAVIGSNLGGLGLALRLAASKYHVEVFEADSIIGSHVRALVGDEIFTQEIDEQFKFEDVVFHTDCEVSAADAFAELGFDAIMDTSHAPQDEVYALAQSLNIANEIDAYLRTGTLDGRSEPIWAAASDIDTPSKETEMVLHDLRLRAVSDESIASAFRAEDEVLGKSAKYSVAGIVSTVDTSGAVKNEAARCLRCRCDACRIFCDLTDYYGKWPQRIRDEVFATTLPGSAEVKATPAKRLMSTCNLCGVCADVCPVNIDMGALILEGRRSMHRQGKAPWVFHDFWLRDMEHANGEESNLARTDKHPSMVFFPGCQLSAEAPELVLNTFDKLSSILPDIGILTRCCGAPAEWSGDEAAHKKSLDEFARDWIAMGEPLLLAACPTCVRELKEYLPQIPVTTIYEKLDELQDLTFSANTPETWAVFDPCSAGHSPELKSAVRNLALRSGIRLGTLPLQDEIARCCGYGGQPSIDDPVYAQFVAKKRVSESELPYITYCINCREAFKSEGKKTVHILELLFSSAEKKLLTNTSSPTVTQRRTNRVMLKKELLKKYWGEEMDIPKKDYGFDLDIPDVLRKKLDSAKILEDEIYETIDFALYTSRYVVDEETGARSAYHKIGHMTYWVTFAGELPHLTLINAYSHRMSIELEPVWNGVKVEIEEK
jgi:Fe-S oxidoreductase